MAILTIGVLAEARYLAQSQPRALVEALQSRGHRTRLIDPARSVQRAGDHKWLRDLDGIVARGRSWDLFALLSAAESFGIPTVNRRDAIASVHNKAEMAIRLAADGLPIPRTYIGTPRFLAATVPPEDYPLIVKPIFGDNSRGIEVFCSADDLRTVQHSDAMIGQRFLENDGFDVKLYAIGSEVWTVRKPSPLRNVSAEAELLPLTAEARSIAWRCGAVFGLQLFGVDCVQTPHGLSVIEVNDYPNYSAVPDAGDRIAHHVEKTLQAAWRVAS